MLYKWIIILLDRKLSMKKIIYSEKFQHYSIRKFSVGVASVLIGSTLFLGSQGQKVQAADNKPAVTEESNSQLPSDGDSSGSKSDTLSGKEQTPDVASNEQKDNNATNTSVVNKPTNEQVSAAQDEVAKQELSGDTNASGNRDSQTSHKATSLNTDSNKFELTSTITNNTDHDDKNIFAVTVLPNTKDGKSEFDTHLTRPIEVEGSENAENVTNWYVTGDVGKSLDTLLTKDKDGNYEPTKDALEAATVEGYFKVKKWKQEDWDKVTAVITTVDSLKSKSSLKIHLHTYDPSVETDVGKNAYMSQAVIDSTSFKKLRTGRTINYVTADKSLSSQKQSLNDVAIYHTNAVTGDMVGDAVLEKGLPGFDIPTFDGYNVKSISGGNNEFWQDYDPDNPTNIFSVTVIKNLQDAKVSTRTGYAQIPNYTITVIYESTDGTGVNPTGGGNTNTLALFSMLAAMPQTPDKVEQHTSIINAGDQNSAKLTVVGKTQSGIPLTQDELPIAKIGVPGVPLTQDNLPYANVGIPGEPLTQDKLPIFTGGVPGIPLEYDNLPTIDHAPGIPLEQPDKLIAEIGIPGVPLMDNKPIAEIGIPGVPLTDNKPIAEIGIPGVPLMQDNKPIAEIGIPGIPLTDNKPIAKIGIPGVPLTQDNKPIAKIGIPGIPLTQDNKPKVPIPVENTFIDTPPLVDNKDPQGPTPTPDNKIPDEPIPIETTPNNIPPITNVSHKKQNSKSKVPTNRLRNHGNVKRFKAKLINQNSKIRLNRKKSISNVRVIPKKYKTNNFLPQTGQKNSTVTSIFGLIALSVSGLIIFSTDKHKKRK